MLHVVYTVAAVDSVRVPLGQLINNSDCAPVYNADPAVRVAATAVAAPWAA